MCIRDSVPTAADRGGHDEFGRGRTARPGVELGVAAQVIGSGERVGRREQVRHPGDRGGSDVQHPLLGERGAVVVVRGATDQVEHRGALGVREMGPGQQPHGAHSTTCLLYTSRCV